MATITKYVAQQQLQPDSGGMPRPVFSNVVGEALQGVGRSIAVLGEVQQRRQQQKEDFVAADGRRNLELMLGEGMTERAENIAVDGEGFHKDFMENVYQPAVNDYLNSLPKRLREKYAVELGADGSATTGWSIRAATTERDQTYKWFSDQLLVSQEQMANAISLDPELYDKELQEHYDRIDAAGLPTPQKMEQRKAAERLAQLSALNRLIETNPEGVVRDLGADPRLLSPTTQFDIVRNALIQQESGGRPNVVSNAGAVGLMQVMPETAREIAREIGDSAFPKRTDEIVDYLSNPSVNVRYGEYYLKKMIKQFGAHGLEAALVAYNGGPKRAQDWITSGFDDSVLPAETSNYYKTIMKNLQLPGRGSAQANQVSLTFASGGASAESKVNLDLSQRVKSSFAALGIRNVKITSGYRSVEQNRAAGGAGRSQHVHGNAMDIDVSGYTKAERVQIIRTLSANGITGIGVGTNIIHADLGGRRAWGYKTTAGGGPVPDWAIDAIEEHLEGKASMAGAGLKGRYASLPWADRQQMIARADQTITQRYNDTAKASAVAKVETQTAMQNELASLERAGSSTGAISDEDISTVLGEDDYMKFVRQREVALKTFNAKQGMLGMGFEQLGEHVRTFEPDPGSPTFADDQRVYAAVQKEEARITRLRANAPDEAAMEYPEVKAAYAKIDPRTMDPAQIAPNDVQEFIRTMIATQKEFNLKPGSEAPVPRAWGMRIGKTIADFVPELGGKAKMDDVRAALLVMYTSLQETFGEYTEEVILYSLREYKGVGPNTGELITGLMEKIQTGGDPMKLLRKADRAVNRDDVEGVSDGWFGAVKRYIDGDDTTEDEDPGEPEPIVTPEERIRQREREAADQEAVE